MKRKFLSFKKIFLVSCLVFVLSTSFQSKTYAANIFGITDPAGCESKDIFLPTLVICGRNQNSGACAAYSKPCTVGDLVETGSRAIVWLISLLLLIVPLLLMYYGFLVIYYRTINPDTKIGLLEDVKKRFWYIILYFILMLSGWLIVRTVVDVFQVDNRINTFLIDENGNKVQARQFNTN